MRYPGIVVLTLIALAAPHAGAQLTAKVVTERRELLPGAIARYGFPVDSGRGFLIAVSSDSANANLSAVLLEPGGRPTRSAATIAIGKTLDGSPTVIDASDAVQGLYQVMLTGDKSRTTTVSFRVIPSPVRLSASLMGDNIRLTAQNLVDSSIAVRFRVALEGAVVSQRVSGSTASPVDLTFPMASWPANGVLDLQMSEVEWRRLIGLRVTVGRDGATATYQMTGRFLRIRFDASPATPNQSLKILLYPEFKPDSTKLWNLDLQLAYHLGQAVSIDPGGSPTRTAVKGSSATEVFPMKTSVPRPLPIGFDPLVQIVAMDADHDWWRIVRLAPAGGKP